MQHALPRLVGSRVRRKEDPKLITGTATFVGDIQLPKMLHVGFLRSTVAHARIKHIDLTPLKSSKHVADVLTAENVKGVVKPVPLGFEPAGLRIKEYPVLASDKIRYVGEPLVAVACEDPYILEDSLEAVNVDCENLDVMTDVKQAQASSASPIFDELGTNVVIEQKLTSGDPDLAFKQADLIVEREFRFGRQCGAPLEPLGTAAHWDAYQNALTVWSSTQFPHILKRWLAEVLSLPENAVRTIAPAVGGGFGAKSEVYPEEILTCLLSIRTGRPTKWVCRGGGESLLVMGHEREQIHQASIALRKDGTILAIKDAFAADLGAYLRFFSCCPPIITSISLAGPYKIQNYTAEWKGVLTNKTPLGPYRGFGQPQATFIIERLLELGSRELGLDSMDVRMRNLVAHEEFPYKSAVSWLDSGNYHECLKRALSMIEYESYQKRVQPSRKKLGVGVAFYVEGTGYAPRWVTKALGAKLGGYDRADVMVHASGKVTITSGMSSHGQGLETSLAQIAADELGMPLDDITIIHGDTDKVAQGIGTWASRSAVVSGAAIRLAARKVVEKGSKIAAKLLEARVEDVAYLGGKFFVKDSPSNTLGLKDIAYVAELGDDLPEGLDPGLNASHVYYPEAYTTSNGVHAAVVEVDSAVGQVRILRYAIVHDCGVMINPNIVEGQIHGGVAQGIAGSIYENLVYDRDGQPLSASYMNYLIPTSMEIPSMEVDHVETPSPVTPEGVKGMGEGGVIPVAAAIANAICSAYSDREIEINSFPFAMEELWRSLRKRPNE
jgi:carbon-monoxide dehydrogenase large subunit